MKEIWKSVHGYRGIYEVSNLGNVRSLNRTVVCRYTNFKKSINIMGRVLKPNIGNTGYYYVALSKKSKIKSFRIHSLVCRAF